MRRQLNALVFAVTLMIVVAFTVPLALLVNRQAEDRTKLQSERQVQVLASLIAINVTSGIDQISLVDSLGSLPDHIVVSLPDGTLVGSSDLAPSLTNDARELQSPLSDDRPDGGWEVAIPVVSPDGVLVVSAVVPADALDRGVSEAWTLLGLLGVVIVASAVWIGDWLARRLVEPASELTEVARRLGSGDMMARSHVSEPEEFRQVGEAFNQLAERIDQLLAEEREVAADLSHRLRTPLTGTRLRAERLSDDVEREEILAGLNRIETAIDELIVASRAPRHRNPRPPDLVDAIRSRAQFWEVLAKDQEREMTVKLPDHVVLVDLDRGEIESVVDVLVGNVFAHTPAGTPFSVEVVSDGSVSLKVTDAGPGMPASDVAERGISTSGSTGLGLDIARRTAEKTGGELTIEDREGGGAIVTARFG